MSQERKKARQLDNEAVADGRPLDWFEELYSQVAGDESGIPWADMRLNPNLATWLEDRRGSVTRQSALVVGCGLGDDAEELASLGWDVTAFDISPTCIDWCHRRFPDSSVNYLAADLFDAPPEWQRTFDFVFESYTLQVLPPDLRSSAIQLIANFVSSGGRLLVISRGRDATDDPGQMPWPLLREELDGFRNCGLNVVRFENYIENEEPPVRRFRVDYQRRI
ncbi:MAG: class I SAM-dependent methyltransferase [Planctomycetales bacterium]|nr:class I SAM-dependent methyltransferase [Planctomycetaceae bacterium]MCA9140392.1 class I SAM-dependent methyltransferase [Planctomycetales bacterium]